MSLPIEKWTLFIAGAGRGDCGPHTGPSRSQIGAFERMSYTAGRANYSLKNKCRLLKTRAIPSHGWRKSNCYCYCGCKGNKINLHPLTLASTSFLSSLPKNA